MRRVAVLLSAYDGERFLAEQVESVLSQQGVDVTLLVRDDGSRDGTLRVLDRWRADARMKLFSESNIGVVESFFRLLSLASDESDYFAFCDQDDVWRPDKLRAAVDVLDRGEASRAQLYTGRLALVGEDLRPLGASRLPRRPLAFENALVENVVTGCAAVFNRRARELMLAHPHAGAQIHDWWLYLVVAAFGDVHYDPSPRVLYRQHDGNVIGVAPGVYGRWSRRLRLLVSRRRMNMPQLEAFRANFGAVLSPDHRRMLNDLVDGSRAGPLARIRLALSSPVYRQTTLDHLALRALIACGLL